MYPNSPLERSLSPSASVRLISVASAVQMPLTATLQLALHSSCLSRSVVSLDLPGCIAQVNDADSWRLCLQDDSAALNSDSAEEVAWTPTRGPAYHPAVPLPPSPMPMVGHETAAAVNLLSMSIREADLAASRAAAAGAHAHRSTPPALTTEQLQQVWAVHYRFS